MLLPSLVEFYYLLISRRRQRKISAYSAALVGSGGQGDPESELSDMESPVEKKPNQYGYSLWYISVHLTKPFINALLSNATLTGDERRRAKEPALTTLVGPLAKN
jgi:hypothetical protein